jgi:hypothetical protein
MRFAWGLCFIFSTGLRFVTAMVRFVPALAQFLENAHAIMGARKRNHAPQRCRVVFKTGIFCS